MGARTGSGPTASGPERLRSGLVQLGIEPAPLRIELLLAYLELLVRWNRRFNLTAVRDPGDMVPRHLLDSLSALRWLSGERVLDVGSGAGLPGIPLAVVDPGRAYCLLDSNGKKTRFLEHAVAELGLANVDVVQCRVADFAPGELFDTVICRAFSAVPDFVAACGHLTAGGPLLALKGRDPAGELTGLPADWAVEGVERIVVPYLDAERHIVVLRHRAGPG